MLVSEIFWTWVGYEYLAYCWKQFRQDREIERLSGALKTLEATVKALEIDTNTKIHNLSLRQNEIRPAYYTVW